jgi:hypothetical protein
MRLRIAFLSLAAAIPAWPQTTTLPPNGNAQLRAA